jgi:hypothetical protein
MKKLISKTLLSLTFLLMISGEARAAFVLSIEPSSLEFNVPGLHSIDMMITHDGLGFSTLSGYIIRFGSPDDASLGELPLGVTAVSAVNGLVQGELFNLNPTTNTVAASSLFAGNFDVGISQTARLFTLNLDLGDSPSYLIGVDFQSAQRGILGAEDISSEFFNPNSSTTDFTFQLTNVSAVPEPGSGILLASLSLSWLALRRKRNRRRTSLPAVMHPRL